MMAFQSKFEELICKNEIKGESLRVFFFLVSQMEYENKLRMAQIEMAEKLNMSQSQVTRAIKKLREYGLVEKEGKGPLSPWKINSKYFWKGTHEELSSERIRLVHSKC